MEIIEVNNLDNDIDGCYNELLISKKQFKFIKYNGKCYAITKEKSIIPIDDVDKFLNGFKDDIYYKTILLNETPYINENDLNLYYSYIEKYKEVLTAKKYNDKYYFGCVAIKTDNGFITTIRGKEDLNDFTIIKSVDHDKHIIYVYNKKATLNAPLIDYLFKNANVKAMVHLHEMKDNNLPILEYAIPGTVRDSKRRIRTSFNIKYHGAVYLFDKKGNIL